MIQTEDLIGRPYMPGRCIGAVREVLRRRFPDFEGHEIPDDDEEVAAWFANPPRAWKEVGKSIHEAKKDGDVIYGSADGEGYVVVVTDAVGRIGLTATKDRGVHARPLRMLTGVSSVQRRTA